MKACMWSHRVDRVFYMVQERLAAGGVAGRELSVR